MTRLSLGVAVLLLAGPADAQREGASRLSAPRPLRIEGEGRADLQLPGRPSADAPVTLALTSRGDLGAGVLSLLRRDLELAAEVSLVSAGPAQLLLEANAETVRSGARVALRLSCPGERGALVWERTIDVEQVDVLLHRFVDRALEVLTGHAGAFASRIAYARRVGPGQKDVWIANYDGTHPRRVSAAAQIATLPSINAGHVWYSVVSERGVYITRSDAEERPVLEVGGTNTGAVVCDGRVFFSSTRDGNSELYSATLLGGDVRRLTEGDAIDLSPTCTPDGGILFVSDRSGTPQLYTMRADGSDVRRLSTDGLPSQTPAICETPSGATIVAYTQTSPRMRIMLHDPSSGRSSPLTAAMPGRERFQKDPAFSPDCRMIAYASARGIVVRRMDGGRASSESRVVYRGPAQALSWAR